MKPGRTETALPAGMRCRTNLTLLIIRNWHKRCSIFQQSIDSEVNDEEDAVVRRRRQLRRRVVICARIKLAQTKTGITTREMVLRAVRNRPEMAEASTLVNPSQTDSVASMARIEDGNAAWKVMLNIHDDRGTDQSEAADLGVYRDNAFDASNENLALALGRPTEEIEQWTRGSGSIDGDVVIKARALAMQRGVGGN
jgi:hypothetical protein